MKTLYYDKDSNTFTLQMKREEIQELILYLGHGRHAKGLDALNYDNLGWDESAKIARAIRDSINDAMNEFNHVLTISEQ